MNAYVNAAKRACEEVGLEHRTVAGRPDFVEATLAEGGEYVQMIGPTVWVVTDLLSDLERTALESLRDRMNFGGKLSRRLFVNESPFQGWLEFDSPRGKIRAERNGGAVRVFTKHDGSFVLRAKLDCEFDPESVYEALLESNDEEA